MDEFIEVYKSYYLLAAGTFGLCIGSFLNVVIYRLPKILNRIWRAESVDFLNIPLLANETGVNKINLCWPSSHCPLCLKAIPFFYNIPLLGFLFLGGKCSACRGKIHWRYPLVELIAGLAAFSCAYQFGFDFKALAAMNYCFILIVLLFIDFDFLLLPDCLTLLLLWLGLLVNCLSFFAGIVDAVIGAVLGYLVLWSVAKIYFYFTKNEGIGRGDFKLTAALGAWLGWQALPLILLISAFSSLVVAGGFLLQKKMKLRTPIPFGSFLVVAGFIMLFYDKPLESLYFYHMSYLW
ncbi:MAG: type IV pilus prepilin peptidase, PilD [uncultured bacterium]|nr:MAG: type IV pilus prepilin peptidase, PilD [uncultured bacterium]OGT15627.1 MAG: hypothetical protein A3B69_03615 [Gammaproteobacteria bacterium RIFCSPHIGHO2_02_FULL_38_33]OGT68292.1 MAG: hypothetical protein A3I12_06605 [Gammaproteobacteria bacterium RIFCSPLOWO2_02_FULL_38_11]OGT77536.1 MAG: hypothetical protein A3G71_00690 [Gammaproteobacteria bacterium RIFCSPLOWO2_12_FULL_38_14]